MKRFQFLLVICLLSATLVTAQGLNPDNKYRSEKGIADSLRRQVQQNKDSLHVKENATKATEIYIGLSKRYRLLTTDAISFFGIAIDAGHSEGFYIACKFLIVNSGMPVSKVLGEYYWGEADLNKQEPFASVLKRIKKEESVLIKDARLHLDWMWNIELAALYSADQAFRSVPWNYFTTSSVRIEAMIVVDSTNLVKFCKGIAEDGFPSMSTVGLNAADIQALLRHFTGLIFAGTRGDFFVEKWKFMMPYLHKAVIDGEMDAGFYDHICDWLATELKEHNRNEDVAYFKKFER